MKKLSYWIKERHNPQFDKPYYVTYGQMTKAEAYKKEDTRYGTNYMLEYKTEAAYLAAAEQFKKDGFRVTAN